MAPKNSAQTPSQELSWIDSMRRKLESLYEIEAVRNPNKNEKVLAQILWCALVIFIILQVTSAYLEKQMATLGTNIQKFCAEFGKDTLLQAESPQNFEESQVVQEMLLLDSNNNIDSCSRLVKETSLSEPPQKVDDGSQVHRLQLASSEAELGQSNALFSEAKKPIKKAKLLKADGSFFPAFFRSPRMGNGEQHLYREEQQDLQQDLIEKGDAQYFFVNENNGEMALRKLASSMERTPSGSLNDWELI